MRKSGSAPAIASSHLAHGSLTADGNRTSSPAGARNTCDRIMEGASPLATQTLGLEARKVDVPETRYSRSADGVHIAYQVLGDADLDLVVSPGFVSHLEHSWEDPQMARFLRRLASFSRLIVFDKRGTGMSDRSVDEDAPLLEDRVNDIATLMDTVGSERAAMMGLSETGAVALLFAATYPERTRAVVAYGSFAGKGGAGPIYPWIPDPETAEWLEKLEETWGRGMLY